MSFTLEEKIQQLEKLLSDDPEDHLGHFMLGRLYMEAARHEDAAREFAISIEQNPEHSASYRQCGDAYRKDNKPEKAREVYERGIVVAERRGDLQTVKEMQAFLRKLS
ncbi:hypothetical protein BH09SUM1_BH09SUM1_17000 [soil metagenome]